MSKFIIKELYRGREGNAPLRISAWEVSLSEELHYKYVTEDDPNDFMIKLLNHFNMTDGIRWTDGLSMNISLKKLQEISHPYSERAQLIENVVHETDDYVITNEGEVYLRDIRIMLDPLWSPRLISKNIFNGKIF